MKKRMIAGLGLIALLGTTALGAGAALAKPDHGGRRGPAAELTPERMADHCRDRFARDAARLSFVEARLDLTDAQKPLWRAYADQVAKGDTAQRDACLAAVPAKAEDVKRPTAVDRGQRRLQRLEAEAAAAKAEQPVLEKLYGALTEKQREILDRPGPRDGGPRKARFERDGRHGPEGREPPKPQTP
ncbi:Spy/CpxP family protein refolding chaperone [Zavarzinia compransoris]|uniref:LTXXQ motif family protein n=1 Tax=Zavarzinia compransoris TaxID=1264899 RepID=A0A317E571_9PROT|nr:Spy/CpxP family protein refolding chaperone [Zavarzinia compransoris]PWR22278.1 hypothetical protein DKG75_09995 [Zavarzinia compransoris]TDP46959.1 LTXXQ motif family protein [Zavarzinia compransoris]